MKPTFKHQSGRVVQSPLGLAIAAMIFTLCGSSAWAASTQVWTIGGNGNFGDATKYVSGIAPVAGDTVTADGTGSIIAFDASNTISLATLSLNVTSGATTVNQTAGDLTLATLNFGGAGGSRNPIYNLSGGSLSTAAFAWSNGSNARFKVSGGTMNHSGGSVSVGVGGGSHGHVEVSLGTYNHTGTGQIQLGTTSTGIGTIEVSGGEFKTNSPSFRIGSQSGGTGNITLSGAGVLNANGTGTRNIYLGNNGGTGNLTMSGTSQFNAAGYVLSAGQFGTLAGCAGNVTMSGGTLSIERIALGGDNANSSIIGVVNLNGGTIATGAIRLGASTVTPSLTANVVHANGGKVKVVGHALNSSFFLGAFVDLQAGGLFFDTDSNSATISNIMSGAGGFTKQGDGVLTLTGTNTYQGVTKVEAGQLTIGSATVIPDANNLNVMTGALVSLDGLQERVGSLTLGPTAYTANGTYGSSLSGADVQSDDFFTGTGTILIGPPQAARNLAWTAAAAEANFLVPIWMTAGIDENFINTADSSSTIFHTGDTVTFNDLANPDSMTVTLSGNVQPGGMVFNNTADKPYVIVGNSGSILGAGGLAKNGAGDVTVAGLTNTYTGAIAVNVGKLIMGSNSAFGATSGITIASGAQVDINGKAPGSVYTYTVSGTGPGDTGAIVNNGAIRFGDAGIKNLVLTGDTSIGNNGNRFDFGQGGTVTGNNHTLTKIGGNDMGFRGDASGTPIHIVVAAGNVWAETSSNAYGGTTGTLTIKSGARAGTYGSLTITTPVTIESGGTLHNQGVATGIWTGDFSLTGNVTIDSAGSPIAIMGNVSGTANVSKGGAGNVTIADPDYVGNTTVTSGPLTLTSATLYNGAMVTLNGGTSTLSLAHGIADTVDKLFLDGVQQAAGTYVSMTNIQSIPGAIPTAHIVGDTGSLVVTTSPVVTGYSAWADANITNPAYASLKGRQDDPDTDGFTNIQEFLFGTDPQTNTGTLTQMTQSGAILLVRWNERNTGATYILQESITLAENPWPASGVTPVVSADQSGVPTDYTRKGATVPIDIAHKFVRVVGVEN
ncbi:MAG: autotransporter-associated beta strand repeat-containing protein [Luteolibacter sp.]|uniref:beta strand repeat-containing protein n=1 Tax=Luteolibacter sp. TaxID=1962973 RepID=UPI0032662195